MKRLLWLFFIILSLGACQQEVDTFGQQIAKRIQSENQTFSATRAMVYSGTPPIDSGDFRFDGELLVVGATHYNLNKLVSYRLSTSAGTKTLTVYF